MKMGKTGLFIIASLILGGLCAWILRREYDKIFMMEGHFHVMSTAKQDHDVVLEFPSGKEVSFNLKKSGLFDFKQSDTGEGSITVSIDGEVRDQVGYVTSMNGIVVLVIGDGKTETSQIFPSLSTKQGAAADADKPRG